MTKPVPRKPNPKRDPITPAIRKQVYERDGKLCSGPGGCGLFIEWDDLEIDHELPKGHGGGSTDNRIENLWAKHAACNRAKGSQRLQTSATAVATGKIHELIPDDKNANRGTERGNQMVENSLREFGLGRSILLDRNGKIIAGNKTVENAAAAGFENMIVVETTGEQLVAVQRVDLDMDKDPLRARELGIADNRAGEVNLEWDPEMLRELQQGISLEGFFSRDELAEIYFEHDAALPKAAAVDIPDNESQDLQAKWQTAPDQLWIIPSKSCLGRAHSLYVGASTQPEDVHLAMHKGGALAQMLITRVPEFIGSEALESALVNWDLNLEPGGIVYLAHKDHSGRRVMIETAMRNAEWKSAANIIAVLPARDQGNQDFGSKHVAVLYGWKIGAEHYFCGDRTLTTVWKTETDEISELFARMIAYSSRPGDVVAAPWSGTGAAFIAAEHAGRVCHGLEKEARMVAVTLERLAGQGLTPERRL
jgi:hypothetical protein